MRLYRPGQRVSPSRVGGKAANLSWLHKKGYPVPRAVFLPKQVLRKYLRFNGLEGETDALAREAAHLPAEKLSRRLEEIRRRVENGRWTREMEKMLAQISERFSGKVAVRSSAIGEDSAEHSFAGQYATRLNVDAHAPELGQAVLHVWASAWQERVIRYRLKNKLPLNAGLAVIVQDMLEPRLAGVAFSLQPDDPEERCGVIEFVHGLGEQLVDGSQTPQRLIFERERPEWRDSRLIPEDYRQTFERLRQFVLRMEQQSGAAVDVEWAMESPDELYVLQLRPVSVQTQGVLWTQENVGEVMPDVVTPFSWSILKPLVNQAYEFFLKGVGIAAYPSQGLFALYRGRVYFNHSAFRQVMNHFYFSRRGGRSKIAKLMSLLPVALHSLWFFYRLPRHVKNYMKRYDRLLAPLRYQTSLKAEELLPRMDSLNKLHRRTMALHISCTIAGELYYQLLDKLAQGWLEKSADELLRGSAPVASSQSAKLLAALAGDIKRQPRLKEQILQTDWSRAGEVLEKSSAGQNILRELDDFLEQYGHGALHEFELYYPRWREEPEYIWRNLQNYLTHEQTIATDAGEETTPRLHQWAGAGLIRKIVLTHIFGKAKFYTIYREELKQAFLKAHSEFKKYLLATGEELHKQGIIEQPLDALFFSRRELEDYLRQGTAPQETLQLAAERKEQRRRFEQTAHPAKVHQIGEQWIPLDEQTEGSAAHLKGISCSAGVIRGKVKIIKRPEMFSSLQEGEILVATATNPGWAPLIMSAAAVVTEIGGALSHGAIIAREFGVPMVAAVPQATKRLHDGQLIEVDGSSGVIKIINLSRIPKNQHS